MKFQSYFFDQIKEGNSNRNFYIVWPIGELTTVAHVDVEATPECAICEFVARELEKMLQKNSTEVHCVYISKMKFKSGSIMLVVVVWMSLVY